MQLIDTEIVEFEEPLGPPSSPYRHRPQSPRTLKRTLPVENRVRYNHFVFPEGTKAGKLKDLLSDNLKLEDLWVVKSTYNLNRWLISLQINEPDPNYKFAMLKYDEAIRKDEATKTLYAVEMASFYIKEHQYLAVHSKWKEECLSIERQKKRKLFFELRKEYLEGNI